MKRFDTVFDLLEHTFSVHAKKPAFTSMGATLSYEDIDKLSYRFASYLQNQLGLKTGDRIAIQLPNVLAFPVAYYGAVRAGLVVVNTNPLYTPRELLHQLKDSQAKVLVVLSNVANSAAEIIKETDVEQVIVTSISDFHPPLKRHLINFVIKYVKKMVPKYSFEKSISIREAIELGDQDVRPVKIESDHLLMLQYTGGTTGVSKGAMLNHHNLCSNVWQVGEHIPEAFGEQAETLVACLPLYHIYALNLHLLAAASCGSHNLLIVNPRDLAALVAAIKPWKFTVFVGINTLFTALSRFDAFKQLDFSKLKITSAGGMALTMDAAEKWQTVTGCKVVEGYGLTETSPVVSGNQLDRIQLGTIGTPVPETEVKVIDDEGADLPTGEVGELCVRGPQVMMGYWQRPDETANVLSDDGWLKTGDMAIIQEDGYIKIVDRKKDMIIVSGFNVYPNEIEDIVCQLPDVLEAAAIGVPHEKSGESVKLFVVRTNDSLTEKAILEHCEQFLTGYKMPKSIQFCEDLPKTNVGKILRRELRSN